MYFLFSVLGIGGVICLVAAIIPAIVLMRYIYKKDAIEKEPTNLLLKLVGFGVLSALIAMVLETVGEMILYGFVPEDLPVYPVFYAFLVVATAEEGMKFILMKAATWKHPAFDFKFDAIVYAVFVSLGFAGFENIFYVFEYGLSTAVIRAFISVPGHMAFAVVMGYFYGVAKQFEQMGDRKACRKYLWTAFISSSLLHGFFDACLMLESIASIIIFFIFIVVFYIIIFMLIKREANNDHIIINTDTENMNLQKVQQERMDKNGSAPMTFHQINQVYSNPDLLNPYDLTNDPK